MLSWCAPSRFSLRLNLNGNGPIETISRFSLKIRPAPQRQQQRTEKDLLLSIFALLLYFFTRKRVVGAGEIAELKCSVYFLYAGAVAQ